MKYAVSHSLGVSWWIKKGWCIVVDFFEFSSVLWSMMIVWRVRGKIIRSVCAVLCAAIVHWAMHTCIWTDLTVVCWLDLAFLWLCCVLQFICVRFIFLAFFYVILYLCMCALIGERDMLSPVRLSSVVGNTRAPYSGGSNFPQYFYGIWYFGHPLASMENFTEMS